MSRKFGDYEYNFDPYFFPKLGNIKLDNRTPLRQYTDEELKAEQKRREDETKRIERNKLLADLTWKNVLYIRSKTPGYMHDWSRRAHDMGYKFFAQESFTDVYYSNAEGSIKVVLEVSVKDVK